MEFLINKTGAAYVIEDCLNFKVDLQKFKDRHEYGTVAYKTAAASDGEKTRLLWNNFKKFEAEGVKLGDDLINSKLEELDQRISIICGKLNPINMPFEGGMKLLTASLKLIKEIETFYEYNILKRVIWVERELGRLVGKTLREDEIACPQNKKLIDWLKENNLPLSEGLSLGQIKVLIVDNKDKFTDAIKKTDFSSFEQFAGDLDELNNYRNLINHGRGGDVDYILSAGLPHILNKMQSLLGASD